MKIEKVLILVSCFFILLSFTESPAAPKRNYILSEYEGQLALFQDKNTPPIQLFEINLQELPSETVKQVKTGIPTTKKDLSPQQVKQYLEQQPFPIF